MTSERTFEDFSRSFATVRFQGTPTKAFSVPTSESTVAFVPPVLTEKDSVEDPVVTLVSARGAAGKSTVARELARNLSAPLWLLELDQAVSGTALEHVLARFLGDHAVADRVADHDNPIVVIDSLDEARSRVSGVSWTEFIESLSRLAKAGLRFVLFGRERSLEDTWVALSDQGLSISWWEISHFAPEQCVQYVDSVVFTRAPKIDLTSNEYRAARDALIGSLRNAAASTDTDEFVGYAPVLDAAAAMFVGKPNLLTIRQQFENAGSEVKGRIELLRSILDTLLVRDQAKVKPLVHELALDPDVAYSPDEQMKWLCHYLENADTPDLSYIAESSARYRYSQQIATFAEDHPFRADGRWASPIFEAYVASIEFDGSTFSSERLIEIGHKSGLLLDFITGRESLSVNEWQFAALHASLIASERFESMTSVRIDQITDGTYEGSFDTAWKNGQNRETTFALIPDDDDFFTLRGPLAELAVHSSGTIVIPGQAQGVVLGPDLFLSAQHVRLEGASVEFARRPEGGVDADGEASVVIEAGKSLQLPPYTTQLPPASELEISVPPSLKLSYPWHDYRVELTEENNTNDKVIRLLNKLMNLTRSHGHKGERGVFVKKFQGRQPFKTNEFRLAIGVLESMGVIRLEGELVLLRNEWEPYRYSGKALKGQRQLRDVFENWEPVIRALEERVG